MTNTLATITESELLDGEMKSAFLPDGTRIALFHINGGFYATQDTCTHENASLNDEGTVDGDRVTCTWNYCEFSIVTGEALNSPCSEPLRTFPVRVIDGVLHVDY
ncbi:non-heme iron oxygenase ferredoxin subunit [uncultured Nevskia sp.]|uniref:non-heme iron oxygenase ferredoxin subunit n=1 Tax=uncultured Nevskia sp. TaxID=228950 RepID=UPI0025E05B46|nr:non-heme iron oxygenase ferredoxin subunit [uncultured Nevskia sp.]